MHLECSRENLQLLEFTSVLLSPDALPGLQVKGVQAMLMNGREGSIGGWGQVQLCVIFTNLCHFTVTKTNAPLSSFLNSPLPSLNRHYTQAHRLLYTINPSISEQSVASESYSSAAASVVFESYATESLPFEPLFFEAYDVAT